MTRPVPSCPPTPRAEVVDDYHGVSVADPYRWLEDADATPTQEWVAAQNARTRELLDTPQRQEWSARALDLLHRPVVLGVTVRSGVLVTLERPAGRDQAVLMARHDDAEAAIVLVDPAARTDDGVAAVDWFHLSPDGSYLAYGLSEGGTEHSVLYVVHTSTGQHLDEQIPETRACSLAWEPDSAGFFYTRYPADDAYHRTVHHHRLGEEWSSDPVVWSASPTPETWAGVDLSPDGSMLLVTAQVSWSQTDLHLLWRNTGTWETLVAGEPARHTMTFDDAGRLIGVTTLGAPNGRVVEVPLGAAAPDPSAWRTIVAERPVVLGAPVTVGATLVLPVTDRATDSLEQWDLDGHGPVVVQGLGVVTVDSLSADPATGRVVAVASGFDAPAEVYDVTDGIASARTEGGVVGPALEVSEVHYSSLDGTTIGMFLVHRADLVPTPATPAILTGYGGFAISSTPSFSPLAVAWCEAGGLYAVAGLRGGLEHGDTWHRAGKRGAKQRVFDDFHAAADWLVDTGRTSRERLAVAGGSNGGLLVGVAATQRPDLCRAVWCAVPLLDMIRFPQFLIARLWTEEYGDPDVAEEFAWLHAYSPYHHVAPGTCYPAVLLTTAEGDSRVDPLHARKMAAALQWATSCGAEHPILLHQDERAGHGVGKPVGKRAAEIADVLTFFAEQLGGIAPTGPRTDE